MQRRARNQEAKDLRRKALLSAALDEFYERGFTAARMDDIAARAGLSKGTIYLYFDSKDALFTSLVEEYAVPNVERLEAAVDLTDSAIDAVKALSAMAPSIIRDSPVPKIMKILIADAPAFPDMVTAYRKKVVERALGAVTHALEKSKASGELEVDDPALTARLVVAPVILSALWRILFEHDKDAKVDVEALIALHAKTILRGLGADE